MPINRVSKRKSLQTKDLFGTILIRTMVFILRALSLCDREFGGKFWRHKEKWKVSPNSHKVPSPKFLPNSHMRASRLDGIRPTLTLQWKVFSAKGFGSVLLTTLSKEQSSWSLDLRWRRIRPAVFLSRASFQEQRQARWRTHSAQGYSFSLEMT